MAPAPQANGYLRIADFGLAAPLSECGTTQVGTVLYQAPELVRNEAHGFGAAADVEGARLTSAPAAPVALPGGPAVLDRP